MRIPSPPEPDPNVLVGFGVFFAIGGLPMIAMGIFSLITSGVTTDNVAAVAGGLVSLCFGIFLFHARRDL